MSGEYGKRDEVSEVLRAFITQIVREELGKAQTNEGTFRPDDLLDTGQVAVYAKVSRDTVRRWIREGRLKCYGAGRSIRIKKSELDALMKPGRQRLGARVHGAPRKEVSPETLARQALGLK